MLLATRRVAGGVGRRRGVLDGRRAVVARCFCATPPKKDASSSSASSSSASSSEASSPITSPSPEKSPPPPWRQIAILSGSSFIANAGFGCIIPVLPSLSESLSLGAVGVGVILSAPAFARVLLNVRLGRLADEIGRRPLMIVGSALGAAGTFATGSAGSVLELVPARLLAGAGSAATLAGAQAYMADVTEGRADRGRLLGVQQAAVALGFIGGPALGGGFAEVLGPHALFHAVGVCNVLCVAGYALLPETVRADEAANDDGAAADDDKQKGVSVQGESDDASLARAWKTSLPPLLGMQLAQYLGYACHLSVVPLRAVDVMAASPSDIGVLFSTVSAVAIVGAPLGGFLADYGRRVAVLPAAALTVAGACALPLAGDRAEFYAAMVAWGLGASLMTPALAAMAADVSPPTYRATVVSYSRTAQDTAFLCGPLAYGAIADALSPSGAIFASGACSASALAFFAAKAPETLPRPTEAQRESS